MLKRDATIGDQMGRAIQASTRYNHFGTARTRYLHDSNSVGPTRGPSWVVFGLTYKPIERHKHDPFTVGLVSTMLGTDNPSNRARPSPTRLWPSLTCPNRAHHIYKYDQLDPHFKAIFEMVKNEQQKQGKISYFEPCYKTGLGPHGTVARQPDMARLELVGSCLGLDFGPRAGTTHPTIYLCRALA